MNGREASDDVGMLSFVSTTDGFLPMWCHPFGSLKRTRKEKQKRFDECADSNIVCIHAELIVLEMQLFTAF